MDNLQQNVATLNALGVTLPGPLYIFGAVLFGLIGAYAWIRGGKLKLPVFRFIGLALMMYPLFVSETWMLFAMGTGLCVALYINRK